MSLHNTQILQFDLRKHTVAFCNLTSISKRKLEPDCCVVQLEGRSEEPLSLPATHSQLIL